MIGEDPGQPDFAVADRTQQRQHQGAKKFFQSISPKNSNAIATNHLPQERRQV
jgi:hypothetical protein